jgi:GNAT superfamily N-acetyltransferase
MLPTPDEHAVVAVSDEGDRLGAAWASVREPSLLVDDDGQPIAEMAIAVVAEARGQGIGTALIGALADEVATRFSDLSLNMRLRNPATRLYTRTGFYVVAAGRGPFGVAIRRRLTSEPPG